MTAMIKLPEGQHVGSGRKGTEEELLPPQPGAGQIHRGARRGPQQPSSNRRTSSERRERRKEDVEDRRTRGKREAKKRKGRDLLRSASNRTAFSTIFSNGGGYDSC